MSGVATAGARLAQVLESNRRIEQKIDEQGEAIDDLDRALKPYGDGTRFPRRRQR
jgi:hypothetical protein